MSFIKIAAVSKFFDNRPVFKNLSLEVRSGELVKILGENGAGKSTLLKIISGLIIPDSGEVLIAGQDMQKPNCFEKIKTEFGIGYLNSFSQLYSHLSIKRNLTLYADLNDVSHQNLASLVDRFSLKSHLDLLPSECSSGILKKITFIRTILIEPKLIILDEPFVHLDFDTVNIFKEIITDYAARGSSIVFVSHDDVSLGERKYLLKEGQLSEAN